MFGWKKRIIKKVCMFGWVKMDGKGKENERKIYVENELIIFIILMKMRGREKMKDYFPSSSFLYFPFIKVL